MEIYEEVLEKIKGNQDEIDNIYIVGEIVEKDVFTAMDKVDLDVIGEYSMNLFSKDEELRRDFIEMYHNKKVSDLNRFLLFCHFVINREKFREFSRMVQEKNSLLFGLTEYYSGLNAKLKWVEDFVDFFSNKYKY